MAQVTCQVCKLKDDKILMCQEKNKKYYHIELCHELYISETEFRKLESEKWSLLYEYVKSLHDILMVPPRNIKRLQDLRNGIDFKDGKSYQKYKQGVPYELMLDAYKLSEDKIKWFIKDVLKGSKDAGDINKCITLMLNSLNVAWAKEQHRKKQKEDNLEVNTNVAPVEEIVYKKKEALTNDISDFL